MACDKMTVYWGHGSPPCYRVLIALGEKNLKYDSKMLSFLKAEHKGPEVMEINPRGQLPTFKHGNLVINESLAICQYLEDTFKGQGTTLLPEDPKEKGMVLQRMHEGNQIIPKLADCLYYEWRVPEGERHDCAIKRNKEALTKELQLWEDYLKKCPGQYLVGDKFTLADVSCYPMFAYLFCMGLCEEKYPKLAEYCKLVKDRPSTKAMFPIDPPLQVSVADL